jgi:hypothetical protein
MNKFDNKYLMTSKGIIHIKEAHPQANRASSCVEIDDYVGDIWKDIHTTITNLNNGNLFIELTDYVLLTFLEVKQQDFLKMLKTEMQNTIDELKKGNSWALANFKQTDERKKIIRIHYGPKP